MRWLGVVTSQSLSSRNFLKEGGLLHFALPCVCIVYRLLDIRDLLSVTHARRLKIQTYAGMGRLETSWRHRPLTPTPDLVSEKNIRDIKLTKVEVLARQRTGLCLMMVGQTGVFCWR